MSDIVLGKEQLEAIKTLTRFINTEDTTITMSGAAGTGKTVLINEFIKILQSKRKLFVLAAPTHKAKLVMEMATGCQASTIHQLLSLQPNLELFELDFRDLVFLTTSQDKPNMIPYRGFVIIDEASMINDELFDFIVQKCKESKCKIVFVGDSKQLQPVKSDSISKVFLLPNVITLTKIYRQKEESPVLDLLSILRDKPLNTFNSFKGKEDSINVYHNVTDFLKSSKDDLIKSVNNRDILNTRILAYTNERVSGYNIACRKLIFNDGYTCPYHLNEILTGCENFEFDGYKFYNSLDYIITEPPVLETCLIPYVEIPLNGYRLHLWEPIYKTEQEVFIVRQDINNLSDINNVLNYMENVRLQAVTLKSMGKRTGKLWTAYYAINSSFATSFNGYFNNRIIKKKTFDYGYALTVHRSQGSGFNSVYVDMNNINLCSDENVVRQLQYVAVSRTRGDATLLI